MMLICCFPICMGVKYLFNKTISLYIPKRMEFCFPVSTASVINVWVEGATFLRKQRINKTKSHLK